MTVTNTTPNLYIYQNFLSVPSELTETMLALILGPHYYLCRFSEPAEKDLGFLGDYDPATDTTFSWPNRPAGAVVDEAYTELFVQNAMLRYFEHQINIGSIVAPVTGYANEIRDHGMIWKTANGYNRSASLYDRDVQIGDAILISGNDVTGEAVIQWNSVVGFAYDQTSAYVTSPATADAANASTSEPQSRSAASSKVGAGFFANANLMTTPVYSGFDSRPYGESTETYTLVCVLAATGGDITSARFNVISSSGKDNSYNITLEAPTGTGTLTSTTTIGTFGAELTLQWQVANIATPAIAVNDGVTLKYYSNFTVPVVTANGTYTGTGNRTYLVRVVGISVANSTAVIVVSTTDNSDSGGPYTATINSFTTIGNYGVGVKFATMPCPGDRYYISCIAAANGPCRTLVLRRSIPTAILDDPDLNISLFINKTVQLQTDIDFTQSNTTLTVLDGLYAYDASYTNGCAQMPLPIISGDLYLTYRALRNDYAGGYSNISNIDLVESTLGPAVADNPLSLGVYEALSNSSGQAVGFIAIPTDNLSGYNAALAKVVDNASCYDIVPMTQEYDIQDAIVAHVNAQSTPQRHRWRISFMSSACPTQIGVATTLTDNETVILATIGPAVSQGPNIQLQVTNGTTEFISTVSSGDVVRIDYQPDGSYSSYVVDQVIADDILLLMTGPTTEISQAIACQVWHNQTADQQAAAYAGRSAYFANRRIRHVFPDKVTTNGVEIPSYFLCAALAGLKSAAAPHQPLTGAALNGFDSVPRSTVDMTEAQLDAMAAVGTWVVTQQPNNGKIYTRMSLTTDDSDANHWQDIRTSNCDSITFGIWNRLIGLIQGAIINDRTLSNLAEEMRSIRSYYMSETNNPDLGPQLLDLQLISGPQVNELFEDEVDVAYSMDLPYEMGRLNMPLYVS